MGRAQAWGPGRDRPGAFARNPPRGPRGSHRARRATTAAGRNALTTGHPVGYLPTMRGLYAIVDLGALKARSVNPIAFSEAVLSARPAALQLRAKEGSPRDTL